MGEIGPERGTMRKRGAGAPNPPDIPKMASRPTYIGNPNGGPISGMRKAIITNPNIFKWGIIIK